MLRAERCETPSVHPTASSSNCTGINLICRQPGAVPTPWANATPVVPAQGLPVHPQPPLSAAVRCPAPVAFENGMYTPRLGSHPVGGNLSFECEDGFVLRGSPVRQCRPNGMWDEETAVCDNGGEWPG